MSEILQKAAEIEQRFNAARQAVIDWMNAEGAEGRLRQNSDAPGWDEYKAAEGPYLILRSALADQAADR
jgi:hypothetical protein